MMTRLPWQNGRSRTKSGSEKNGIGGPYDWFSRTTSEPSRQALTELVKQHKREQSDGSSSASPKSRLRSNTASSQDRAMSSRGRSDSTTDDVVNASWYPLSAHDDASSLTTEKMEGTARSLLNKSSFMLRRRGSKLSLSSNGSSSTLGFTSPSRAHSINASTSRRASRDDMRSKISAPFDFQHVTHSEQTQFTGLGRIDESELAHRFSTMANEQRASGALKGIEASNLQPHDAPNTHDEADAKFSASAAPVLLSSPPRPRPPPKDELHELVITTEILMPQVLYSPLRLSPISPTFPNSSTFSEVATTDDRRTLQPSAECLPMLARASHTEENSLASKPLPQLPVIHAVTTEDDSARAMIAAPLPTPPGSISPGPEVDPFTNTLAHQRQKSSVALPRHYTLYPSSKSSMPNLLSADRAVTGINTLSRHHSDMALSRIAKEHQISVSTRTSMSFAAVDTMDWEAAVDEAWDDDVAINDSDLQAVPSAHISGSSRTSPAIDNLFVEQSASTSSTPLMMAQFQQSNSGASDRTSPPIGSEFHKLDIVQEDEPLTPLSGLGISSFSSVGESSRNSAGSNVDLRRNRSSTSSGKQHCLTRSSSQESVIYSLASSIIETQRSSKSSVSTGELKKIEDLDIVAEASGEESEPNPVQSRIRPESGCLPLDILDQYRSIFGSGRHEGSSSTSGLQSEHKYQKSASKITVPERRSSVSSSHAGRFRSNTIGERPRQTSRVSYSLFPAAQQSLMSAPISS